MTHFANYRKAVKTAIEVLEDYEISQVPVDLWKIFNALSREIAVKTYGDIMTATGKSREEIIGIFNSNMGVCCYRPVTSQYLILYRRLRNATARINSGFFFYYNRITPHRYVIIELTRNNQTQTLKGVIYGYYTT